MKILIALNMGDIIYIDITYNRFLHIKDFNYKSKKHICNAVFINVVNKVIICKDFLSIVVMSKKPSCFVLHKQR
jgi:hypothetical protein